MSFPDAVVVGAGPNGLSAAIVLARAGLSVHVFEANDRIGGGARSMELTLPGLLHDAFSAVYPLAVGSPFLSRLPLDRHGLRWIHSPFAMAHPFEDGTAAVLARTIEETVDSLRGDGVGYRRLFEPLLRDWPSVAPEVLAPLHLPRSPLRLTRFGVSALMPADTLARRRIGAGRGAALFSGSAAHAGLPLTAAGSSAFGLVLHLAGHGLGWPIPEGGSGSLTRAMASYLRSLGGTIETGIRIRSLDEIPPSRLVLLDISPRQLTEAADGYLPRSYLHRLRRFRYGVGVFKVDWALSGPIPWRAEICQRAATVHVGGSFDRIVASTRAVDSAEHLERPFTIVVQPTLFDRSRSTSDEHIGWAYCHVPNGSTRDMTEAIEAQIERFAPGFRDLIIGRRSLSPADLEAMNWNLVGGDVNGGSAELRQIFFRPVARLDPYRTPVDGVYICSASTPPGGGVHGMCGYHAARSALASLGIRQRPGHDR